MKASMVRRMGVVLTAICLATQAFAQTPQAVKGRDERYKVDILVVVAHPDDEGFFTPYLARAINDLHKRVAVVYSTRGGSGGNHFARERGAALANIREIEAREACAKLGIPEVWFLDGKDTASQNPLDSLSNWGHGANLEELVGLVRLTRPEVIFTHMPAMFIGENHGDHQATGILATEAFDLAASPVVFPSQLAGDTKHYEVFLSNLQPWQVKKIYYGSDAANDKQFEGTGPAYSIREVSPSLNKPYWRIALESGMAHRTQFPDEIEHLSKMSDAELEKVMSDPNTGWWSEPLTITFGKSTVGGKPTDDVFAHLAEKPLMGSVKEGGSCLSAAAGGVPRIELGGPWEFYAAFYGAHELCNLPVARVAEMGVTAGKGLVIPVVILHDSSKTMQVNLTMKAPDGWKVVDGAGQFLLPAEESTSMAVQIETPALSKEELKKAVAQEVTIHAESDGKPVGEVQLRVLLRGNGLPQ